MHCLKRNIRLLAVTLLMCATYNGTAESSVIDFEPKSAVSYVTVMGHLVPENGVCRVFFLLVNCISQAAKATQRNTLLSFEFEGAGGTRNYNVSSATNAVAVFSSRRVYSVLATSENNINFHKLQYLSFTIDTYFTVVRIKLTTFDQNPTVELRNGLENFCQVNPYGPAEQAERITSFVKHYRPAQIVDVRLFRFGLASFAVISVFRGSKDFPTLAVESLPQHVSEARLLPLHSRKVSVVILKIENNEDWTAALNLKNFSKTLLSMPLSVNETHIMFEDKVITRNWPMQQLNTSGGSLTLNLPTDAAEKKITLSLGSFPSQLGTVSADKQNNTEGYHCAYYDNSFACVFSPGDRVFSLQTSTADLLFNLSNEVGLKNATADNIVAGSYTRKVIPTRMTAVNVPALHMFSFTCLLSQHDFQGVFYNGVIVPHMAAFSNAGVSGTFTISHDDCSDICLDSLGVLCRANFGGKPNMPA